MVARSDEREQAIAAAEQTCPRCGARRTPEQDYCLDCGLRLPVLGGRIPALRRRWIRRLGWYPGDWVWLSLATLVVAIAGAGVSIALAGNQAPTAGPEFTATSVPVTQPTPVPTTTVAPATTTSPSRPKPKPKPKPQPGPRNGRLTWPANENGWTVVLVSYPKSTGHTAALDTAAQAAKAGLPQVGILDSSRYASLQPGYFVVFAGIYGTRDDADAAAPTARSAGFSTAYSRQIAR